MNGNLRVKVDFRKDDAVRQLRELGDKETKRIITRGLNRAAVTVRAEGAREIVAQSGQRLAVAQVKKAIRVVNATRASLTAIVRAVGKNLVPLTLYRVRQTRTGVRATISGKTVDIPHAFIATMKTGRKGVWIRAKGTKPQMYFSPEYNAATKRLPIAQIFAPGIPEAFVNERVMDVMRKRGAERFREVVEQEYRFAISKLRAS